MSNKRHIWLLDSRMQVPTISLSDRTPNENTHKRMKLKNTKWIALLAVAGMAICAQSAKAVTINQGDLIFGVRDTSTTTPNNSVYLFDLGAPPPSGADVASGLGADLAALFGSDWYTNTSLQWSISGYSGVNTLIASKAEPLFGTQSSKYGATSFSSGNRTIIATDMQNIDGQYGAGSTTGSPTFTAGGTSALGGVAVLNSAVNGYASYMPGYTAFGGVFEALGFSGTAVDMYTINGTLASNVVYSGSYYVNSNGDVIFSSTAAGVVATPEGGNAFALMGIGLGCLVTLRNRFSTKRA